MKKQDPLISCICITKNRPLFLQRAIACFERQEYLNKELIISYPSNDLATKSIIDQIEELSDIHIIRLEHDEQEKLGTSRNKAVLAANGTFVCFWDDDDWYSQKRISSQFSVLRKGPFKASILMNVLIHDDEIKESYYSLYRYFHGTLLCEKKILTETHCSDTDKREMDHVIPYLLSRNVLFHITEKPDLYIFMYHGNNALGEANFNYDLLQSILLDQDLNKQVLEITNLKNYHLKSLSN
jgi:glycosyltransferase involved in cell wall biosynthesis